MTDEPDPYRVLGVRPDASFTEIRAAYAAAVQTSPSGAIEGAASASESRLDLLDATFRLLSDPESRARYDARRAATAPPPPPASPALTVVSDFAPPDRSATVKLGSGISPLAWIGLSIALIALGRVALGFTPAHWPIWPRATQSTSASETADASSDQVTPGAFIEWKASDNGNPHAYSAGDLTATLSTDQGDGRKPRPKITVIDGSGATISALGQVGSDAVTARFGVGKIDPQGRDGQVLFLSYSGGAHCCTQVVLLERGVSGWRKKDLGTWDGDALAAFPTDIDGDGTLDLVFNDQRFAYAFAPYSDSLMPPRVFNVIGGRTSEVSGDPRYQKFFEGELDTARSGCLSHNNGACAAYVAIAAWLGRRDEAWETMLPAYDQSSTWPLPTACRKTKVNDICPKGDEISFKTFPAALAWFLMDAGYPYWNSTAGLPDPNRAPTFDCSSVTSINLKLVCATPELSAADRSLAAFYGSDVGAAPDPTTLRTAENAWIIQRNQASPDIDALRQLYEARIAELRTPTPQQNALESAPPPALVNSPNYPTGPARPPTSPPQYGRPVPGPAYGYRPYITGRQFMVGPRPPGQSGSHPHHPWP